MKRISSLWPQLLVAAAAAAILAATSARPASGSGYALADYAGGVHCILDAGIRCPNPDGW